MSTETEAPRKEIALQDRMIVALDLPDAQDAMRLMRRLRQQDVTHFKVGLQLFLAGGGFEAISRIESEGGKVFLDLKMLDIPATVRSALRVIATQHPAVVFATIHMLNRGFEVFLEDADIPDRLKVLVVTVLTSMDEKDWSGTGAGTTLSAAVSALTARALQLGCHGVIASGQEAAALRKAHGDGFLIVTPGIRPAARAVENDDQKRAVTPRQAILNGADYLVVGRPIAQAPDPVQAARQIQEEIAAAVEELANAPSGSPGGGPGKMAAG